MADNIKMDHRKAGHEDAICIEKALNGIERRTFQ
jgi:hypothetical protein